MSVSQHRGRQSIGDKTRSFFRPQKKQPEPRARSEELNERKRARKQPGPLNIGLESCKNDPLLSRDETKPANLGHDTGSRELAFAGSHFTPEGKYQPRNMYVMDQENHATNLDTGSFPLNFDMPTGLRPSDLSPSERDVEMTRSMEWAPTEEHQRLLWEQRLWSLGANLGTWTNPTSKLDTNPRTLEVESWVNRGYYDKAISALAYVENPVVDESDIRMAIAGANALHAKGLFEDATSIALYLSRDLSIGQYTSTCVSKLSTFHADILQGIDECPRALILLIVSLQQISIGDRSGHLIRPGMPNPSSVKHRPLDEVDITVGDVFLKTNQVRLAGQCYYSAYCAFRDTWTLFNANTLRAASKYCLAVALQGNASEAVPFLHDILAFQRRIVGYRHPDVAFSHAALVAALYSLSQFQAAMGELTPLVYFASARSIKTLDLGAISDLELEIRSNCPMALDFNSHISQPSVLRLFKIGSQPKSDSKRLQDSASAKEILGPYRFSEWYDPIKHLCHGNLESIHNALNRLRTEPFSLWHKRIIQISFIHAIDKDRFLSIAEKLREHVRMANWTDTQKSSVLGDALIMAAEKLSAPVIGILTKQQSPGSDFLEQKYFFSALRMLLKSGSTQSKKRGAGCLSTLLVDSDVSLESFTAAMTNTILCQNLQDLELLVTHMNGSWGQTTPYGVWSKDKLLSLQQKNDSWDDVLTVLSGFRLKEDV